MPKKSKLPEDPRDHYIYSENKISLRELSALYKKRRGSSFSWLKKRCAAEKWDEARTKYRAEQEQKTREKILDRTSEKKAKTLAELNIEHTRRTQALIRLNEQLIKQATKVITDENGEKKVIIDLSPSDLRRINQNIIDAQAAERLYHNFWPKKPIEDKDDNSADDSVLADIFLDLLGEDGEDDADEPEPEAADEQE